MSVLFKMNCHLLWCVPVRKIGGGVHLITLKSKLPGAYKGVQRSARLS